MPRGVYERKPGKKSKAFYAGNLPPKKYGKGNSGSRMPMHSSGYPAGSGSANNQQKSVWLKYLLDMGYGQDGDAPNLAVQSVLCMISNREIHEDILRRHRNMSAGCFSPINHLGFSSWIEIFSKMDEKNMDVAECMKIMEDVFAETQGILADRTDIDDVLALEFKVGVTYLEKVHKHEDVTFEAEANKQTEHNNTIELNTTKGFAKYLPNEDREVIRKEKEATKIIASTDGLLRLTLHNCLRFPIISEMAIEWLGEEFQHALWRSLNYSTLAPISIKAWCLMGGIESEDMMIIIDSANNLTKLVDKVEFNFPFSTNLFGKKCVNNTGTTMFVKAHMGYLDTERNYSYLHRIWRSFSPYFKCNCNAACNDSITWFDQAIWYVFNHLDEVYPRYSPAGRMASFMFYVQQNLKTPIMAQLAYMQVREMMVKITNKLAANSDADLQSIFGNTKLVEVCELMVKDKAFLVKKLQKNKVDATPAIQAQRSKGGSESFFPPRVARTSAKASFKTDGNIVNLSDSIVSCTPGEASVNKGSRPEVFLKGIELRQARLQYDNN